jgi:hypothetical protein
LDEEVHFAKKADPPRMFRFDFGHMTTKVAIEVHGAVWTQGRHTRGGGFIKDREKMNLAASLGWTVFELTAELIQDRRQLERIAQCIHGRAQSVADAREERNAAKLARKRAERDGGK